MTPTPFDAIAARYAALGVGEAALGSQVGAEYAVRVGRAQNYLVAAGNPRRRVQFQGALIYRGGLCVPPLRPSKAITPRLADSGGCMTSMDESLPELSIQERLYPDVTCFGCGFRNAKGLRLRSYPGDDMVTATFTPWPEHDNGIGYLNGGIISTVLDCHSAAAVMLAADRNGWAPLAGALLPYVTSGLDVRYLRPSPLREAVSLRAVVTSADNAEITVHAELLWQEKVRASATAYWKRWRPRSV